MKKVYNVNIEHEYPLPTPHEILSELPLSPEGAENIWNARSQIKDIVARRDKRILVICGPCSIDSLPAATEYAMHMKSLQPRIADKMFLVMRTYFEKPRTTVGGKDLSTTPISINRSISKKACVSQKTPASMRLKCDRDRNPDPLSLNILPTSYHGLQ